MTTSALVPTPTAAELVATDKRGSLVAWFNLYLSLEAGANAANTLAAKTRDLRSFVDFFITAVGADEADLWTRSITGDFIKRLQHEKTQPHHDQPHAGNASALCPVDSPSPTVSCRRPN
jgi:lipase chaperone LimK